MTESAGGVQSVGRAFALLELLADAGGAASLSELAAGSGLAPPTIHRLLRTLADAGYVRQLADRRYGLGPGLIRLGEAAGRRLGAAARPQLARLVDDLGETANLAVLDADMVVYVGQAPSPHSMRMFTEVGRRAYAHATGVGKAILAQLDDAVVRGVLARAGMPVSTARTIVDADALLAELGTIRGRGFAIDEQEQEIGVRCFAVAVPGAPTPTAISVSGPVSRVDDAFAARAVPALEAAARELAGSFGGS